MERARSFREKRVRQHTAMVAVYGAILPHRPKLKMPAASSRSARILAWRAMGGLGSGLGGNRPLVQVRKVAHPC